MLAKDLLTYASIIVKNFGENEDVAAYIMTREDVENEMKANNITYELTDDKLQSILEQVQEMAQFQADQCIYTILNDLDDTKYEDD